MLETQGKEAVQFQSTLSVRRATKSTDVLFGLLCISIHALREESDLGHLLISTPVYNFNPRSP